MNAVLKNFIPVADMIADTFGSSCEAVVHDLTAPENSVVYVANGSVTGRKEGQSFDHLIKQVLLNRDFNGDKVVNYRFETPDGRHIKSSSSLIRNEAGEVVGMLCVNCDIGVFEWLQRYIECYLGAAEPQPVAEPAPDVMAIIDTLIRQIIGTADVKNLNRKKCVEIIKFMDDKGVFLVKGALEKVAALMGVSKVTVYSYLDEAKGKR